MSIVELLFVTTIITAGISILINSALIVLFIQSNNALDTTLEMIEHIQSVITKGVEDD